MLYLYLLFFKCWLVEPVRFNRFQTLETETEPNRNFFVIFNRLIRFFFYSVFLVIFFSGFLGLISLSVFLLTLTSFSPSFNPFAISLISGLPEVGKQKCCITKIWQINLP